MPIVLDARTATDHFPGIGRYVISLAEALPQAAPDLDLMLLHAPGGAGRLPLPGLPGLVVPASPFSLRQQWQVPRLLHSAGASLYHSPYFLMPYRPGCPAVLTVHDLIPLLFPRQSTARARLAFRWAMALALHAAQRVIADSAATARDLAQRFAVPPERVRVVPMAAGSQFMPRPPSEVESLRGRLGLPERYVLYVGSNKPHKNLPRLVESWAQVHRRQPGTCLVIAGHWDPAFPLARRRAEELSLADSVQFVGAVPEADLPALYSGAALFVFPSLYEGFGLPVLEAMACGTPVVCADRASLPEIAGEAAVLVDPEQPDQLAEAMAALLADPARSAHLRAAGRARAAQFSWAQAARETAGVYRELGAA